MSGIKRRREGGRERERERERERGGEGEVEWRERDYSCVLTRLVEGLQFIYLSINS